MGLRTHRRRKQRGKATRKKRSHSQTSRGARGYKPRRSSRRRGKRRVTRGRRVHQSGGVIDGLFDVGGALIAALAGSPDKTPKTRAEKAKDDKAKAAKKAEEEEAREATKREGGRRKSMERERKEAEAKGPRAQVIHLLTEPVLLAEAKVKDAEEVLDTAREEKLPSLEEEITRRDRNEKTAQQRVRDFDNMMVSATRGFGGGGNASQGVQIGGIGVPYHRTAQASKDEEEWLQGRIADELPEAVDDAKAEVKEAQKERNEEGAAHPEVTEAALDYGKALAEAKTPEAKELKTKAEKYEEDLDEYIKTKEAEVNKDPRHYSKQKELKHLLNEKWSLEIENTPTDPKKREELAKRLLAERDKRNWLYGDALLNRQQPLEKELKVKARDQLARTTEEYRAKPPFSMDYRMSWTLPEEAALAKVQKSDGDTRATMVLTNLKGLDLAGRRTRRKEVWQKNVDSANTVPESKSEGALMGMFKKTSTNGIPTATEEISLDGLSNLMTEGAAIESSARYTVKEGVATEEEKKEEIRGIRQARGVLRVEAEKLLDKLTPAKWLVEAESADEEAGDLRDKPAPQVDAWLVRTPFSRLLYSTYVRKTLLEKLKPGMFATAADKKKNEELKKNIEKVWGSLKEKIDSLEKKVVDADAKGELGAPRGRARRSFKKEDEE